MADNRENRSRVFYLVGVSVVFITLAFIGTKVITIPIPGTNGYFNLGDTFVMVAGILFGPWIGLVVGAFGPALADLIGYAPYAPATFVIKGLEGLAVGLIAYRRGTKHVVTSIVVGTVIIVVGYFCVQAFIYVWLGERINFFNVTTFGGAVTELPFNVLQGVLSGLIAFGVWSAFRPSKD